MQNEDLLAGVGVLVIVCVAAVALAIAAVICWLLYDALNRVPPEHRKMEPGLAWLLMIPCFNLIWNFFVYLRLPRSLKSYFDSTGRTDVGDCGEQIGLWYAICSVASLVPYLNCLTSIASLVLLIMFLVKVNELKKLIVPASA